MFSFLKNWFGKNESELKKELQEEAAIDFHELSDTEVDVENNSITKTAPAATKVHTELSLHPVWEQELDAEKKYTLRFLQAELPDMVRGQISVTGFSMIPGPNGLTVTMFFRNSLDHPVRFKNIRMAIYLDDKPFARMSVDLSEMGAIPPRSSRPWEMLFPEESFLHDNFAFKRWKVVMKAGKSSHVWPKHLELDPEMEKRMTERQKDRLEALTQSLPPVPADTVQVTGFDIALTKDGRLVAGMLFRNGMREMYNPEKIQLTISDQEGDVVAKGSVDASTVKVKPGHSRPWIIVFPPNAVKKPNANLRRWVLEVK
ncbi:SLAP domain-containing protein [Brevibacillus nitrificans]|uniref:SLAP domain-containing protein n=1 Tax=Brevibacillus nitrificans TaxID=651560 RepID=UPI0028553C8C|nr:SLAP domain-containing protein [Brevibacillus nitrificans]MDR7317998.1 accessory Sec system S-layer assembly protein [Brevibacillus nitrificans]